MDEEKCPICSGEHVTLTHAHYTGLSMHGRRMTVHGEEYPTFVVDFCPKCGRDMRNEPIPEY